MTLLPPAVSDAETLELEAGYEVAFKHAITLAENALQAFQLVREIREKHTAARRELTRATGVPVGKHLPKLSELAARSTPESYELRRLQAAWRAGARLDF